MKPSTEIRKIWEEMKEMKRFRDSGGFMTGDMADRYLLLSNKYEEIETLFGHEITLSKAIICYLDK